MFIFIAIPLLTWFPTTWFSITHNVMFHLGSKKILLFKMQKLFTFYSLKWILTHLAASFCIKKLKNYEHFSSLANGWKLSPFISSENSGCLKIFTQFCPEFLIMCALEHIGATFKVKWLLENFLCTFIR